MSDSGEFHISDEMLAAGYAALYDWEFDPAHMAKLIIAGDLAEIEQRYNAHYLHDFEWNAILPFVVEQSKSRDAVLRYLISRRSNIYGWDFILDCVRKSNCNEILMRWSSLHKSDREMRKKMAACCLESVRPKETVLALIDVIALTFDVLCEMSRRPWWDKEVALAVASKCVSNFQRRKYNMETRSNFMAQIAAIALPNDSLDAFVAKHRVVFQECSPSIWCCTFHMNRFHACETKMCSI